MLNIALLTLLQTIPINISITVFVTSLKSLFNNSLHPKHDILGFISLQTRYYWNFIKDTLLPSENQAGSFFSPYLYVCLLCFTKLIF